jgi:hypothetical protein
MNSGEVVNPQGLEPNIHASRYIRLMTLSTVFIASQLPEVVSKTAEMADVVHRNVLPEPWDLPDHVGNFNEGGLYTAAVFSLINVVSSRRNGETTEASIRHAAVGAFAVSCAIQILGEKYGASVGLPNTGDMLDSAYGVFWSGLAAVALNAGYQKARKADGKYIDFMKERQLGEAPVSKQASVNSNPRTVAKRASPQQKKARRKQQQTNRRKNR